MELTLSRPTGPRDDFTMLATADTAVMFCVRTSCPYSLVPNTSRFPPLSICFIAMVAVSSLLSLSSLELQTSNLNTDAQTSLALLLDLGSGSESGTKHHDTILYLANERTRFERR